jgi:DNA-binding MarR family transcriptional regulator
MADIKHHNSKSASKQSGAVSGTHEQDKEALFELMELFFYAYRDFVSEPDEILKSHGFGRAHHRVIHFVGRNPNLRVADLLKILRITKQSLGRVLKQLIEQGFIVQFEGKRDRRERRLTLTPEGVVLGHKLAKPQLDRIAKALETAQTEDKQDFRIFLQKMIDQ